MFAGFNQAFVRTPSIAVRRTPSIVAVSCGRPGMAGVGCGRHRRARRRPRAPASPSATQTRARATPPSLNFALNLEYLEAEYYLRGVSATGSTDRPDQRLRQARRRHRRPQGQVRDASWSQQYAEEIADDERHHVDFLRAALGNAKVARPKINLTDALQRGRHGGRPDQDRARTSTPSPTRTTSCSAAFVFEDVGVTAYKGAVPADLQQDLPRGGRRHPRGRGLPRGSCPHACCARAWRPRPARSPTPATASTARATSTRASSATATQHRADRQERHRLLPVRRSGAQHRLPNPAKAERGRLLPERRQRRHQHQRRQRLRRNFSPGPARHSRAPRRPSRVPASSCVCLPLRKQATAEWPTSVAGELIILLGVLVLVFGAKKLPDMARSIGQSARVLKGEMKGLKAEQDSSRRRSERAPGADGLRSRARRRSNPDGVDRRSFDHLYELRRRLAVALGAVLLDDDLRLHLVRHRAVRPAEPRRACSSSPTARCPSRPARSSPPTGRGTLLGTACSTSPACGSRSGRRPGRAGLPGLAAPDSGRSSPRAAPWRAAVRRDLRVGRGRALRDRSGSRVPGGAPGTRFPAHDRRRRADHGAVRGGVLLLRHRACC